MNAHARHKDGGLVEAMLRETHALLEGHFLLSSGLHSDRYCQCAKLLEHPEKAARCAAMMAELIGDAPVDVVLAPALGACGRLFSGGRSLGAMLEDEGGRRTIRCRPVPSNGLTVVASRSHGDAAALDAFLAGRKVASTTSAGSSLKLCLLAAGEADLYPRLGRTMEWDIAAGHAVLAAAGGSVCRVDDGSPLRYGKTGFENPHFVAAGLPN